MKTTNRFRALAVAAIVALMTLVSCSKEEPIPGNGPEEQATLTIGIAAPETRGVATLPADVPADAVKNFKAYIVLGDDGALKADASTYSANGTALSNISVTTKAKRIYVIANAGDLAMANEQAILDYVADLSTDGKGSQTGANGRWATGKVDLTTSDFTLQSDGTYKAVKSAIKVTFVAARITLKIEKSGLMATHYNNNASADGALSLEKVVVLNARGASRLFGTSLVAVPPLPADAAKTFYEGLANPAPPFHYYPTNFTLLTDVFANAIPTTDNTAPSYSLNASKYYYYVFENAAKTADAFPTIIALVGTHNGKTIYFPIHLAGYEQFTGDFGGETLTRGNSYNITVTLKGDPRKDGDSGGTTDPTDPVVNALMDVGVELQDWNPVILGKDF